MYVHTRINTHTQVRQVGGASKAFHVVCINTFMIKKTFPKNRYQRYDIKHKLISNKINFTKKSKVRSRQPATELPPEHQVKNQKPAGK